MFGGLAVALAGGTMFVGQGLMQSSGTATKAADVLPRQADAMGGTDRRAATTILTDLRVLAINQRLTGKQDDTKEIRNASLEVSAKQSETLALAADLGKFSLSLRSTRTTGRDAAA